jgi:hypothetical protein
VVSSPSALGQVSRVLADLWDGLLDELSDPDARRAVLTQAGLAAPDGAGPDPAAARATLDRLRQRADADDEGTLELVEILATLREVSLAVQAVVADVVSGENPGVAVNTAAAAIFQVFAASHLRLRSPFWYHLFQALRLIDDQELHLERFPELLSGGGDILRGGPGATQEGEADAWSMLLGGVAVAALFLPEPEDGTFERRILFGWDLDPGSTHPLADRVLTRTLSVELRHVKKDEGEAALLLTMVVVPAAHGGWGLLVTLGGELEVTIGLGKQLELELGAKAVGGIEVFAGRDAFLRVAGTGAAAPPDAGLKAKLSRPTKATKEPWRLGKESSLHLQVKDIELEVELGTREQGVLARFKDAEMVLPPTALGPLKSVMPSAGLKLGGTIGLGVNSKKGFYLEGGAKLRATLPINKTLLGISLHTVDVALEAKTQEPAAITLELAGSFTVDLFGVVKASVDRIGVASSVTFPPGGEGEAGGASFDLAFVPPRGLGVVVNAGPVRGGGFLLFDPDRGEYGGALELTFGLCDVGLSIKAVGLLTERPDGGFSFIIIVSVEFTPAIELFLRFTLNGFGLILGINHGMDLKALGAGLHDGAVDRLLFPKDPVANAPAILSTLRTVFPPAGGRTVVGPMLQLGWGDPLKIVTVTAAVVISTPDPVVVALLGRVQLAMPHPDAAIVLLRCDFLGAVDFTTGAISFDATLHGSRVAWFPITGDLAFRSGPGMFLFSVGGFHPAFPLPEGAPSLRRVGIDVSANPLVRIRLEGYVAFTANTFQMGARVQLDIEVGPFSVHGHLGFDALVQWEPKFRFSVQISVALELRFEGDCLAGIHADVLLEGPGPWHVKGRAGITIIFWEISVPFDVTWGEVEPAPPPPELDVGAEVSRALSETEAWRADLPAGSQSFVTLRPVERAGITAHPLGRLSVRQRVAPLGITVQRVGQARARGGPTTVTLGEPVVAGAAAASGGAVSGLFPRAQFFDLTDDQKLSSPSFEPFQDGVALTAADVLPGPAVTSTPEYETILLGVEAPRVRVVLDRSVLAWAVESGAVARSNLHVAADDQVLAVKVHAEQVRLADTATLAGTAVLPQATGFTAAVQALAALADRDPVGVAGLQVVGAHEVVG